ncbi:major facilitator superfamily protein [Gracilibacillus halophilus YIM-C55.5]|uniref:Major facilitator superfamily protein n=1 Tax=Gracilibacillus halophilus YIM-C55.5 TaxID=1308866 RepID=N4WRU8_9BACI|nr:MFS transporter [Gracilibacillus halophilus]ENH97105.1 major facilitator superfamily protein [Gracilibacillus halophilus YIM-C55.5]
MTNRKQITFLKALTLFNASNKGLILPFLPLFLTYRDFSSVEIGMIMGIAPMASIIAQPFFGYISDRYKTIKGLLILLYLAVMAISFSIFFQTSFVVVFLSFILFHFVMSPVAPLLDSMAIKSLGKNRRGDYGKIRLWGSVGFASTAVLSGPVLDWIGIEKIYIVFWFLILVVIFLTCFLKDQNHSSQPVTLTGVKEVFRTKPFMFFLFLCFLVIIPHRMNDTMLVLHLEGLGASTLMIGLAWSLAAFSEVPVFYYLSSQVMKYNHLFLLGLIALFYSIRWILYATIDSAAWITFLQISQGITFGLFWLVALQTAVHFVPNHLRSTGQALLASTCFGLGGAVGGTLGGSVLDVFGSSSMYFVMAAFSSLAMIGIFITYKRYHQ